MLIAQKKKEENIAEYILYMWQVEDIIRGFNFDILQIEKNIISKYKVDENIYQQIKDWYADLIEKMIAEKIIKSGHLSFTNNLIEQLNYHHQSLLNNNKSLEYEILYKQQIKNINEFRLKSNSTDSLSDIAVCFNALYAILLLRLKKKEISEDTLQVVNGFKKLIIFILKSFKSNKKYE